MNKRFHITIKDNASGTIELDMDTDCIIGATHKGDGEPQGTVCLGYSDCPGLTLVHTAFGAVKVTKQITNKPRLNTLLSMMLMTASKEEKEDGGVDSERTNDGTVIPFPTSRKDEQS